MQDRQYYVKSVKKIIDEFNILPAGYIAPIKDSLEAISEYDDQENTDISDSLWEKIRVVLILFELYFRNRSVWITNNCGSKFFDFYKSS